MINWRKNVIYAFSMLVLLFLMIPTFIVIPMSFSSSQYLQFPPPGFSTKWYEKFFSSPAWLDSFIFSLKVGFATMILATIIGTLASLVLSRVKSKWMNLIYYIIMTPMIVPLIIIAVAIYSFFVQSKLQGSYIGLVIAHTVIALPYVVTTVLGSLKNFDIQLEQAARSLGAPPFTAFMKITVPIISPALISGALFAFIASFDELIVSIFVSSAESKTLPVRMWEGVRLDIDPTITAISSILIFISIILFVCMQLLQILSRKKGMS